MLRLLNFLPLVKLYPPKKERFFFAFFDLPIDFFLFWQLASPRNYWSQLLNVMNPNKIMKDTKLYSEKNVKLGYRILLD
jgi:hypothetical protein